MRKGSLAVRLPIISTGAIIGCIGEILRLPLTVTAALVIGSQLLLTTLWVVFKG